MYEFIDNKKKAFKPSNCNYITNITLLKLKIELHSSR